MPTGTRTTAAGRTFDNAADDIKDASFAAGNGFTQADFDWAKRELLLELRWLGQVNNYIGKLSKPFAFQGSTLTTWAKLGEIVASVKAVGGVPDDNTTEATIGNVVKHLGGFGPLIFPGSAIVIGSIAAIYGAAADIAALNKQGAPSDDEFKTRADRLQGDLVARLVSTQDTLAEMTKVIAADYEKLKTVGTFGGCVATDEGCPREWQFTEPDRRSATRVLQASIESSAYQSLVPAKFTAFKLPLSPNRDGKKFQCTGTSAFGSGQF